MPAASRNNCAIRGGKPPEPCSKRRSFGGDGRSPRSVDCTRLSQCTEYFVETTRFEVKFGDIPIVFRDEGADRRQGIGARARYRGYLEIAFVRFHRLHFGQRRDLTGCGRELFRFLEPQAY